MDSFVRELRDYWAEPEVAASLVVLINIVGAMFLGLLVGYERSYHGRAAGMRTYGLVCMASCALIVITGYPQFWYGGHTPVAVNAIDPGRVIQGVCTGIGFLGAGVIMRDGLNISGLTTAASIWSVAAIGVLVGVGFYAAAIPLAAISAILMMWGAKLEGLLPSRHAISITVHFQKDVVPDEATMSKMTSRLGYEIAKGSFTIAERDGRHEWKFVAVAKGRDRGRSLIDVSNYLTHDEAIESYHVAHARN